MNRDNSILYKAAKQNENTITELLVNLMRYKYIRDFVLSFLGAPNDFIDTVKSEDISTQFWIEDKGIPDIRIANSNGIILVESKIRTDTVLQKNQIDNYTEIIKNYNKYKQLIFLIPKNYIEINQIKKCQERNNYVSIIYWEDLLFEINQNDICRDNSIVTEVVRFIEYTIIKRDIEVQFEAIEVSLMYRISDLVNS